MRIEAARRVHAILRQAQAADAGAAELSGHHRRARVVEVGLQVGHVVGVHVTAQHHHAGHPFFGNHAQQPVARRCIAVPAVGPVLGAAGRVLPAEAGHQRLLGQQVPGPVQGPVAGQPAFLRRTQQRALRVVEGRTVGQLGDVAAAPARARADLRVAVLAVIQQVQARQAPPVQAAVDARRAIHRARGLGQRQVFPPGLVGGGALGGEIRLQTLALQTGIVVLDLVVVPDHQPGAGGVRGLQRGVGFVLRVAVAVVIQQHPRSAEVGPQGLRR